MVLAGPGTLGRVRVNTSYYFRDKNEYYTFFRWELRGSG